MYNIAKAMTSAACKAYFEDGVHDYFVNGEELPGIWGGKLSKELGLVGEVQKEQFHRMADGLHPFTGEKLTPGTKKDRRAANDITISAPKDFSLLYLRLRQTNPEKAKQLLNVFDQSCDWIMDQAEQSAATRVRAGGADHDRITGNWSYAGFTQFDSRPDDKTHLPVIQIHRHHTVFNVTDDPVEEKHKALQIGIVKENADLWMPMFYNDLAKRVRDLGYGIRRDPKNGIVGFAIEGIPRALVEKWSPRRATILAAKERIAKAEGITNPERLRRLQAELGALTRRHKQKDLSRETLWNTWDRMLTPEDAKAIDAAAGKKGWETSNANALNYGIDHLTYRNSEFSEKELMINALRYGMGSVSTSGIKSQYQNQGVLLKNGRVSTAAVLAQEQRIVDFARDTRGTMAPLSSRFRPEDFPESFKDLSAEQKSVCNTVWSTSDQMILIKGAPGAGKTYLLKTILAPLKSAKAVLAPSVEASRGVLRKDGFEDANTLRAFLNDKEWQEKLRNGTVVLDEFSLTPIQDLDDLTAVARDKNIRLIGVGDPHQHKSVARHGNMFTVLPRFAGTVVAELKNIRRQQGAYRDAAMAFRNFSETGNAKEAERGLDIMERLGWIEFVPTEYVAKAVAEKAWTNEQKGMIPVVSGITHKQNEEITAERRKLRKEAGQIGEEEYRVLQMKPLAWTDPEKGDLEGRYLGNEVVRFHQNSQGGFIRGQEATVDQLLAAKVRPNPKDYAVFERAEVGLSVGDVIRITAGGKTLDDKRLDKGDQFTFKGLDEKGNLIVSSGKTSYTINKDFGHIAHVEARTSFNVQGRTDPSVITVMSRAAYGGVNAPQNLVDITRGRKEATIVTDMTRDELLTAIKKLDSRRSAMEVFGQPKPKPKLRSKFQKYVDRVKNVTRQFQEKVKEFITHNHERESYAYGR